MPSLGGDDFLISGSNEYAAKLINAWPYWPDPIAVLSGPQGSGKTHLVNVWRAISGARSFPAAGLADAVAQVLEHPSHEYTRPLPAAAPTLAAAG